MARDAVIGAEWSGPPPVMAFAARMRVFRAESGNPSLQILGELMNRSATSARSRRGVKPYPRSTIHDKLAGRSKPTFEFVKAFAVACAEYAGVAPKLDAWYAEYHKMLRELGKFKADRRAAKSSIETYSTGITLEWTGEGPKVTGNRVVLSPTEATALLDRWLEHLDHYVEQERKARGDGETSYHAGRILAAIKACSDTYIRVPEEAEIQSLETELARKYNLFYQFMEIMQVRIGARHSDYEIETLYQAVAGDPDDGPSMTS